MPDQRLDILIKTLADSTGIELTTEQIGKLKDTLGKSSEAMKEFGDKTEDTLDPLKEHGEQSEKMHVNHKALDTALRAINPELAHFAHLLKFATGPGAAMTIGVIATSMAFGKAKEMLKEYNDELDRKGDIAAIPAFKGVENLRTSWDNARVAMGNYMSAVAQAGKSGDTIDKMIAAEKLLTDAKLHNIELLAKADMVRESTRLRGMNLGRQADALEALYAQNYAASEQANAIKQSKEGELAHEFVTRSPKEVQERLESEARATEARAQAAETKAKNHADELAKLEIKTGEKSEAQKDLEKAERRIDVFKHGQDGNFIGMHGKTTIGEMGATSMWHRWQQVLGRKGSIGEMAEQDAAKAREEIEKERVRKEALRKGIEAETKEAADARAEANRAKKAGEYNAERVRLIPTMIGAEDRAKIVEEGVTAEVAVLQSRRANQVQQAAINRLHDLAETMGTNMEAIIATLKQNHKVAGQHQTDIESIKVWMDSLAARAAKERVH